MREPHTRGSGARPGLARAAQNAGYIADHIRRLLCDGGSAPHSEEVQRFFKEEVRSRGWRTHELRKVAVRLRRAILKACGLAYLVGVADELFRGEMLEEKAVAVEMLRGSVSDLGEREFRLIVSWLARVGNWADHDALVHYLIAPMIVAKPARKARVFAWAKSKNRWHRRAAAVGLIQGARKRLFFSEIKRVTEMLREDQDDMVQKGLGWLLRETAKADPRRAVPYLIRMRERVPRLVLRTACERLSAAQKKRMLVSTTAKAGSR